MIVTGGDVLGIILFCVLGGVLLISTVMVITAWIAGDDWWPVREKRRRPKKAVVVVDPIAYEVKRRSVERARAHEEWSQAWAAALGEPAVVEVEQADREYVVMSADGSQTTYRPGTMKAQAMQMIERKRAVGLSMPTQYPLDGRNLRQAQQVLARAELDSCVECDECLEESF